MPTKQPRLNVVLEPPIYKTISHMSKREGLSMSLIARDLIHEALLIYEDAFWASEAEAREKTFHKSKALSHHTIWAA